MLFFIMVEAGDFFKKKQDFFLKIRLSGIIY